MKQVKSLILAAFLICTLSSGVRAGDIGSPGIKTSGDIGSPGASTPTTSYDNSGQYTADTNLDSSETNSFSFEELVFALVEVFF